MKNNGLYNLFIEELEDMYSSENQIVAGLNEMIANASLKELKEALSNHLKETKNQIKRIEKIYSILNIQKETNTCEAMEGLIKEATEMMENHDASPTRDAAIIAA